MTASIASIRLTIVQAPRIYRFFATGLGASMWFFVSWTTVQTQVESNLRSYSTEQDKTVLHFSAGSTLGIIERRKSEFDDEKSIEGANGNN